MATLEDTESPETQPLVTPDGTEVKIGDKVLYQNTEGREQVGWVCAVPTTQGYGASEPGTASIFTVSPHSGPYVKHNVPVATGELENKTFALLGG